MGAILTWLSGNRLRLSWTASGTNEDGTAHDGSGLAVTATLLNRAGEDAWTGTLQEVSTTDGETLYAVSAEADADVVTGRSYRLRIIATEGGSTVYDDTEPVMAVTRSDGA